MLAIVFSLEKFHHFSFLRSVPVESDHKPLEAILQKTPLFRPTATARNDASYPGIRHQRPLQERQGDVSCGYPFSCLPELSQHARGPRARQHGGFSPHQAERLTKLKKAKDEDDTLQHLKSVIMNGWPDEKQDLPDHILQLL